MFYIYETTNLLDGCTYIGKHYQPDNAPIDLYYGSGIRIMRAVKKYGRQNFKKVVLLHGLKTEEEANEAEVRLIAEARSRGKAEYNIALGGNGAKGYRHSIEARRRMSEKRKGYVWSEQARQRLSATIKGRPISEEQKKKISAKNKGKTSWLKGKKLQPEQVEFLRRINTGKRHSVETRRKLSEIQMGKRMGALNACAKAVLCVETGKVYACIADASREYGKTVACTGIYKVCRGINKTFHGLHWQYINN